MKKILFTIIILALLFLAYTYSHLFFNSSDQQLKSDITTYLESTSILTDCDCAERKMYIQKFGDAYYITVIDSGIHDDSVKSLKRKFTLHKNEQGFNIASEESSSSCSRGSNAGICK